MCPHLVTYLCMSTLPRATVPAQRMQQTNSLATRMDNMTRRQCIKAASSAKFLCTLVKPRYSTSQIVSYLAGLYFYPTQTPDYPTQPSKLHLQMSQAAATAKVNRRWVHTRDAVSGCVTARRPTSRTCCCSHATCTGIPSSSHRCQPPTIHSHHP